MDLLITLVLIYVAYRGYRWYANLQEQVNAGRNRDPFRVSGEPDTDQRRNDEDYIDYEEVD